ncbi:TetR/AcrR family transcriptional regulator [Frigoribacterium sp. RIT-PI-h]|uniref:TetR/AcrR family transcriptional regulator n=1 Tax=Frigoribacterium sp. RIT-PI-h TaxID=1690245 RepID=UPI00137921F3|nr:TetR/AcrR family transcriptional regulator [Frigoribacterium sp. RIT-PI-h]
MSEQAPAPTYQDSGNTDIRVRIVEATIDSYRHHAFHETTPALVARRTGLSEEVIAAHFPVWDGLVMAAVDRWNAERMQHVHPLMVSHGTVAFLRGIVRENVADPSLMRVLTALLNVAATPNHPMAPLLHHEWRKFHHVVMAGLEADIREGREPASMEPARGAEQLIALYEGLQMQSMVRPRMDLLEAFDRAITRLRAGWSHAYTAPVWDLS